MKNFTMPECTLCQRSPEKKSASVRAHGVAEHGHLPDWIEMTVAKGMLPFGGPREAMWEAVHAEYIPLSSVRDSALGFCENKSRRGDWGTGFYVW